MKNNLLNVVFGMSIAMTFSSAIAGSNNGYTTAANVYSGSSSLGWYGGGVAYRLAEWRKVEDVPAEPDNTVSAEGTPEQAVTATETTAATTTGAEISLPPTAPTPPTPPAAEVISGQITPPSEVTVPNTTAIPTETIIPKTETPTTAPPIVPSTP